MIYVLQKKQKKKVRISRSHPCQHFCNVCVFYYLARVALFYSFCYEFDECSIEIRLQLFAIH